MNRPRWFGVAIVGLATTLSGCSKDPYRDDLQMMCEASVKAPKGGATDPSARAMEIAKWIDAQPKTDKAKKFFSDLSGQNPSPTGKAKTLRDEAKKVGLSGPCPLADWYDESAKSGPVQVNP